MEYTMGYVAFIDVLGFSAFVSKEENGAKTAELFSFVKNLCYLFNSSAKLNVEISFFSDSIVISAKELESLVMPILLAESYLQDKLGLLFRGGIAYGKYYHKDGVTFGPAVIEAYKLENAAIYSRILIHKEIEIPEDINVHYFKDIDGYVCINPMAAILNEIEVYGPDGIQYPEGDIVEAIKNKVVVHREKILAGIQRYIGSSVVEKYLWRIRTFNYTCRLFAEIPCGTIIYEAIGYAIDEGFKEMFASKIIKEDEIITMKQG